MLQGCSSETKIKAMYSLLSRHLITPLSVFTHLCNGKGIAVRLKFVLFTAVMSVCVHAFEFPQHANPCICLHARVRGLSLKKLHHKTRKPVISAL